MGDPGEQSAAQQELAKRLRCYRERIVRRLVVKHAADANRLDWVKEAGWLPEDEARYQPPPLSGLEPSTADILKYKPPTVVPCDEVESHPVAPANTDDNVFKALARLFLARDDPTRQRELFGWTHPASSEPAELALFDWGKTLYWEHVCGSNLLHLDLLKDTADFHANDLLRVLYLAGELPRQFRERELTWRSKDDINRDDNFSEGIEKRIRDALLAFKYWLDDPFYFTQDVWLDVPPSPGEQSVAGVTPHHPPPLTETFYPGDLEAISAAREDARIDGKYKDATDQDMTYWSENHQVLFATAEYLAGQWFPDEVFRAGLQYRTDKEGTRPGDLTGEQRMGRTRPRLIGWLEERLRFGFSEWHAPGYYAEDLRALFNLVDFCLDEEIRVRAQMVLDLMFFDLARLSLNGNFGVTAGRCYFNQKTCCYDQTVGDLMTVMFGTRDGVIVWDGEEAAGSFASSRGYTVPEVLLRIAQDRPRGMIDRTRVSVGFDEAGIYGIGRGTLSDAIFWWGRSAYFSLLMLRFSSLMSIRYRLGSTPPFTKMRKAQEALDTSETFPTEFAFTSGEAKALAEGPALTRANLYTYKTANTMLSSVQNFHAGQLGTQVQACQATIGPTAVVWTSHLSAGGYVNPRPLIFGLGAVTTGPVGGILALGVANLAGGANANQEVIAADFSDGPNWWTGSATLPRVVQHEGAAILAYNPKDLEDIFGAQTHAWFPKPAFGDSVAQRLSSNCDADDGNWTFGRVDDAYVGLFSAREVTWTTDGPWADRELMAESGRNVFIIQVGNAEQFGTYDAFIEKVTGARVHIHGLHWGGSDFECSYDIPSPSGGRLELHDDDHQARFNGVTVFDDHFPRFESPYVKCGRVAWGQYHYTIAFEGLSLTHDFRELRTKAEGATVHRFDGGEEHDCESDRFWVVSNRGARRLLPENTLEACQEAVETDGAMGLLVDACLTSDGEIVLWHDWSSASATLARIDHGCPMPARSSGGTRSTSRSRNFVPPSVTPPSEPKTRPNPLRSSFPR